LPVSAKPFGRKLLPGLGFWQKQGLNDHTKVSLLISKFILYETSMQAYCKHRNKRTGEFHAVILILQKTVITSIYLMASFDNQILF